jgi:multisubunit Na+/H+ antiporter MnhB subunit
MTFDPLASAWAGLSFVLLFAAAAAVLSRQTFGAAAALLGFVVAGVLALVAHGQVAAAIVLACFWCGVLGVVWLRVAQAPASAIGPRRWRFAPVLAACLLCATLVWAIPGLGRFGDDDAATSFARAWMFQVGAGASPSIIRNEERGGDLILMIALLAVVGLGAGAMLRGKGDAVRRVFASDINAHHDVFAMLARVMAPFSIVLAVYFLWRSLDGYGSGFAAGAIAATGYCFYGLAFGVSRARGVFSDIVLRIGIGLGLALALSAAPLGWLYGEAFLKPSVLAKALLEAGAALCAASVLALTFNVIADRPDNGGAEA